jgi:hypothetical protein
MAADLDHAVQQAVGLLDEAWHGMQANGLPEGHSYYSYPDTGLEQTLTPLSSVQAAQCVGHNSIAQQVQHTAFGARVFAAWLRGEAPEVDWDASWEVGPLDDAAWAGLQQALWAALGELRQAIADHAAESNRRFTQATGAVAHVVYHVGQVRAKLAHLPL